METQTSFRSRNSVFLGQKRSTGGGTQICMVPHII